MERTYICIDLKSYYASVECVYRGLDPLKANLLVADPSRPDYLSGGLSFPQSNGGSEQTPAL